MRPLVVAAYVIGSVTVAAVSILIAGFTGLIFDLWPTSWPDQTLQVTPEVVSRLQALRRIAKFAPDEKLHYPGAMQNPSREVAQAVVDTLIQNIEEGLPAEPRKSFVLAMFKVVLSAAKRWDSEDQDRLAGYLTDIMDIVGVRTSNELLTVWRYGFPYGWLKPFNLVVRRSP